jgi:adenosyl cobinamide kinase/adenosyl cobinamide phosphate guanylyltransferase
MPLTLLLGGVRSGKSRLAADLARAWEKPVVVIATAEPRDEEMAGRIRRHQAQRPPDWQTVEEPVELSDALARAPHDACVVVDCLTLWVSNLMELGLSDEGIRERAEQAASRAAARPQPSVVVSNEVGSGIVPGGPLARRFTDVLGVVNAAWADRADRVFLVVAGRLVRTADPPDLLPELCHG